MNEWYCEVSGDICGPISFDELSFLKERGKLRATDRVRQGASGAWRTARNVPNLFPSVGLQHEMAKPVRPPEQPVRATAIPEPREQQAEPNVSHTEAQIPRTPPVRSVTTATDQRRETYKQAAIGSLVGAAIVVLCLLLLLLFFRTDAGSGGNDGNLDGGEVAQAGGAAEGRDSGDDSGMADDDDRTSSYSAEDDDMDESSLAEASEDPLSGGGANPVPPPEPTSGSETVTPQDPTTGVTIEALASNGDATNGGIAQGAPRGVLSGGGVGRSGGSRFLGVKVRGNIALVCDVSGSMSSDFPVLVRELREHFPKNTPLILVGGCAFNPPNPNSPPPSKLVATGQSMPYLGAEFANDEHTYMASNTTDAIIFAVEGLKRNTVMFNNDLQDGGSESAIAAFRKLRKTRRFTLSGRSLNCEAPKCLLEFIDESGGDFKLDPISRTPSPAVSWSP